MDYKKEGIYQNLHLQLLAVMKHCRQGSYETRRRYLEAMERFCHFLAEDFHLQKLKNINAKHLAKYLEKMRADGLSASTIKTDLAGIRFVCDQMDGTHPLPTNEELGLTEQRHSAQVDRAWPDDAVDLFFATCQREGRVLYLLAAMMAFYMGLRIHEVLRLDRATADKALDSGQLQVKGKGGKSRTLQLAPEVFSLLKEVAGQTERGHKLFVPDDDATHKVANDLQKFIQKFRKVNGIRETLTFHGLRHSYVSHRYDELLSKGFTPEHAKRLIAGELGHNRIEIVNTYLNQEQKAKRSHKRLN